MNEADRLFARIAIHLNYVSAAHVEEARQYIEKLTTGPSAVKIPLSLGSILAKLGRLSHTQVGLVQKEMDPFGFTCEGCGHRAFHLEQGDKGVLCETCREKGVPPKDPKAAALAKKDREGTARKQRERAQMFSDLATKPGGPPERARTPDRGSRPDDRREDRVDAPARPIGEGRPKLLGSGRTKGDAPPPPPRAPDPGPNDTAPVAHGAGSGSLTLDVPEDEFIDSIPGIRSGLIPGMSLREGAAPAPGPDRALGSEDVTLDSARNADAFHGPRPSSNVVETEKVAPDAGPGGGAAARSGAGAGGDRSRSGKVGSASASGRVGAGASGPPGTGPRSGTARVSSRSRGGSGSSEAGPDPYIGKTIGGCRIEKFVGRGGMGTVYRASQVDLERVVAFKVLAPQLTADPKQVAQFLREAKALAKLEHPNIVTIYNAAHDKDADVHFIMMQFVDGGSVEALVRSEGRRIPVDRAVSFTLQAGRGLVEAHAKGIIHRDVKPDNMLIADGDAIKVTDFGLARMEGDAAGFSFGEGRIVGTPYYMSPEQIDGRNIDSRTDIYALGATFYYLLTGERPFQGETPVEILLKHVNEELIPPARRTRDVPETLSRIVLKMMAKEPDQRYQSMRDVLRDIEAVSRGQEVMVELPAARPGRAGHHDEAMFSEDTAITAALPSTPLPPIPIERPRSFYYMVAGLGLALLAAVGLGMGPVREIMAEGSAEVFSTKEIDAAGALADLRAHEAAEGKAAVEKYRKHSREFDGTAAAAQARARADELEAKFRKDAEDRVAGILAGARAARAAGKYGLALEILAGFRVEMAGAGAEKVLPEEAKAVREDLAAARGQAFIPAGLFVVGESDPPRKVDSRGVYMDLHEVRVREYAEFVREGGARPPPDWPGGTPAAGTEDLPVTNVAARDAEAFARKRGKRLPTAAEWEKAARGTEGRRFPWGDAGEPTFLNHAGSGLGAPLPVTANPKGASPYGCLNMAGNAAELTIGEGSPDAIWVRGGSFKNDLIGCRTAAWNDALGRDDPHSTVGFRMAQDVER